MTNEISTAQSTLKGLQDKLADAEKRRDDAARRSRQIAFDAHVGDAPREEARTYSRPSCSRLRRSEIVERGDCDGAQEGICGGGGGASTRKNATTHPRR